MMRIAFAAAAVLLLMHGESDAQPAPDTCGIRRVQLEFYASKPLRVCALDGHAEAQAWLGMVYWSASQSEFGGSTRWGVPERLTKQDLWSEGLRLITLAAEAGVPVAQNELGRALLLGDFGVPLDFAAAYRWLNAAAAQDDEVAMFNLARAHFLGWGVPQSTDEAVGWLRRSSRRGYVDAQCTLAELLALRARNADLLEVNRLRSGVLLQRGVACGPDDLVDGFP